MRYSLEIYEPGDIDLVALHYESDEPFGAISKGDLISAHNIEGRGNEIILRVVNIEHIFWEIEGQGPRHKICVFTESHENTREIRLGRD